MVGWFGRGWRGDWFECFYPTVKYNWLTLAKGMPFLSVGGNRHLSFITYSVQLWKRNRTEVGR